ncbi:MAG: glycosyltransferase [Oscillatoriophycideae cyanobacterium NC_groundwater_1537_Pr4_S-0.65um_50_18]|nr:glycosyltransferase [Oscillatoriophycideae cyanobacterium NC_groundwater_1537_Pr4_S-0.65um_50_18]
MISKQSAQLKVTLLVNLIAPYRLPVYQAIGNQFNLSILHGGLEDNRSSWKNVKDQLEGVSVKQSWGLVFKFRKGKKGSTFDYKFIHITPGFFFDLLRQNPDAVISNELGFRTLTALIYGTLLRKPVWVWWGGTLHTEKSIGLSRKIVRMILSRWVNRWISYGETSTEYLLSLGIDRNKILQIQNCVNEALYLETCKPAIDLNPKPVFLYVGQLIYRKGVDKLLEAAAKLQQEGQDFTLLLVGGGAEKESLQNLAAELNLKNITFYPAQPPDRMNSIYHSADYLVFPTLEDVWGLVVNESLWSGIPVLSSIYAGCAKELLPSENTFDPLDADSFLSALRRALRHELPPLDLTKLQPHSEISKRIINDIEKVLCEVDK